MIHKESNETASEFVRRKIRTTVKDPKTAELLCPNDHPIGTKRLILDTDYYEAYNRDNVTLVDIRRKPIKEITPGDTQMGGFGANSTGSGAGSARYRLS